MTTRTVSIMLTELEVRRNLAPAVIEAVHRLRDQGCTYDEIGYLISGPDRRDPSSRILKLLTRYPDRHPGMVIEDPASTLTAYRLLSERAHSNIVGLHRRGVSMRRIAEAAGYSESAISKRLHGRAGTGPLRLPRHAY